VYLHFSAHKKHSHLLFGCLPTYKILWSILPVRIASPSEATPFKMRVRPSGGVTQAVTRPIYTLLVISKKVSVAGRANNNLRSGVFSNPLSGATGISQQLLFYKSMNNGAFGMKNCLVSSPPQNDHSSNCARVTSMPQLTLPATCIA
jgi:hypothetical protein